AFTRPSEMETRSIERRKGDIFLVSQAAAIVRGDQTNSTTKGMGRPRSHVGLEIRPRRTRITPGTRCKSKKNRRDVFFAHEQRIKVRQRSRYAAFHGSLRSPAGYVLAGEEREIFDDDAVFVDDCAGFTGLSCGLPVPPPGANVVGVMR